MDISHLLPLFPEDISAGKPVIIAGPCSAESESQVLDTARALATRGIRIFRAGVWKPRTKPGCFEGIGAPALKWLEKVKRETGMLIATEVANRSHLRQALEAGVDIAWLGARTSANPFAVQEIADALAQLPDDKKSNLVVLVKNPINPDLELWIGAIERIYSAGIRKIGAVHRGFSSYGKHIYRNEPKWSLPVELRRRIPEITLICDPSHIGGRRELVGELSQQALDLNFDGLIIESHCDPEQALSDSTQQVTPAVLSEILQNLVLPTETRSTESLDTLRKQIDRIDTELLDLLGERMRISREIGVYKKEHNMPVLQSERYNNLMKHRVEEGVSLDLSPDFIRSILASIHEESVRQQLHID